MVEQSLVDVSVGALPGHDHAAASARAAASPGPTKVAGVSDTPSRRKIFTCRPAAGDDEVPCAKKIVCGAGAAGLSPAGDRHRSGRPAELLSDRAATRAISSPESAPRFRRSSPIRNSSSASSALRPNVAPGTNYRISDLELASRLSYLPVEQRRPTMQLIALASQGKLQDPAVLEQQVRRMLADPRSEALATNFAGQWLHLQNLKDVKPDLFLYPELRQDAGATRCGARRSCSSTASCARIATCSIC